MLLSELVSWSNGLNKSLTLETNVLNNLLGEIHWNFACCIFSIFKKNSIVNGKKLNPGNGFYCIVTVVQLVLPISYLWDPHGSEESLY